MEVLAERTSAVIFVKCLNRKEGRPSHPQIDQQTFSQYLEGRILTSDNRTPGAEDKVSGGYRVGKERAVEYGEALLRTVGPERLIWASDCPFAGHENQFSYQDTIDAVRVWVPTGPARDRIFGLNALGFYFS